MKDELISSTYDESGMMTYDLAFTRVAAGTPEALRERLTEAFERLNFHVVDDNPLIAKRRTCKWAEYGCSASTTETAATVQVALKPSGPHATRVTFNYTLKHTWLLGWDRKVLAREADALVAFATRPRDDAACSLCGTEYEGDSRYCRRCGAPLPSYEPPEFEALRLMAGSYAAYQSFILGAICFVVVAALAIGAFACFGAESASLIKLSRVLTMLAVMAGAAGLFSTFMGTWRLRQTLTPGMTNDSSGNRYEMRASRTSELPALPEPEPPASIVESTTELLDKEPIPIRRLRGRDTG